MTHCLCCVYLLFNPNRWWIVKLHFYAPRSTWQLFGRIVLTCFTDQFIRTWTFWLDFWMMNSFFARLLIFRNDVGIRWITNSPILFSFIHSMFNWPESLKDRMLDIYLIIYNANIRQKYKTEKRSTIWEHLSLFVCVCVCASETAVTWCFFAVNLSSHIE